MEFSQEQVVPERAVLEAVLVQSSVEVRLLILCRWQILFIKYLLKSSYAGVYSIHMNVFFLLVIS